MGLNGVDIDWEFPVGPDWGQKIHSSPADKENYILLLSDLKDAFIKEENQTGKHYSLSTAVPAAKWFTEKNDVKAAGEICHQGKQYRRRGRTGQFPDRLRAGDPGVL